MSSGSPGLSSAELDDRLPSMRRLLVFLVSLGAYAIRALFLSRVDLLTENLALRQQIAALRRQRPRPPLDDVDRAFWVALHASWPGWANRLLIVDPDTVAKWDRKRFQRVRGKIRWRGAGSGAAAASCSSTLSPERRTPQAAHSFVPVVLP